MYLCQKHRQKQEWIIVYDGHEIFMAIIYFIQHIIINSEIFICHMVDFVRVNKDFSVSICSHGSKAFHTHSVLLFMADTHLHKQQMNRDILRDTLSYCVCSLSAKWIWKKIVKKKKAELLWSPEREEMWLAQLEWTERQTDGQISWRLTWRGNTGHFSVQSWEGRTGPETHCWKTVREMGSDHNTCSPVSHQPLSTRNSNSSKLQVGETAAHLV